MNTADDWLHLGLGAGMKIFDGGDDAFYVRLEGVLPLSRR